MTTTIIFNTNEKLKKAAMRKAHAQGLTLSAVLNMATQAFVDNELTVDIVARDIARARAEPSIPAAEVYRRLGLAK